MQNLLSAPPQTGNAQRLGIIDCLAARSRLGAPRVGSGNDNARGHDNDIATRESDLIFLRRLTARFPRCRTTANQETRTMLECRFVRPFS
jgi:hypothetical protein